MWLRWRQWYQLWVDWNCDDEYRPAVRKFESIPAHCVNAPDYPVRVVSVTQETTDTISLLVQRLDGQDFHFLPGMFLTLLLDMEGKRLMRAYSIASALQVPKEVLITVRRTANGWASLWLQEHVHIGMQLMVRGPDGHFVMYPDVHAQRAVILLAGGSGITPIMSMLASCVPIETASRFHLVYASRDVESIIFRDRLLALARSFPDRLHITWVVESAGEGWDGYIGFLNDELLLTALKDWNFTLSTACLCGPEPMMEYARQFLRNQGMANESIMQEQFSIPKQEPNRIFKTQSLSIAINDQLWNGETLDGETLLAAGLRMGVAMPFSCTLGGCGRCRVQVVQGEAYMPEPNGLMDSEKAAGYVLACQAHACSDLKIRVATPTMDY